jgi:beta-lactamase regulating signal transducer with metallopeptidase domain
MTGILEAVGSFLASSSPSSMFVGVMVVKATIVLATGCLVAAFARKADAALRHGVWALTLAAALGLPIGMIATPSWRVAVLPPVEAQRSPAELAALPKSAASVSSNTGSPAAIPAAGSKQSAEWRAGEMVSGGAADSITELAGALRRLLPLVWVSGAVVVLLWMVIGRLALRRLGRRSVPLDSAGWQSVLNAERERAGVSNHVSLLSSESVSTPLTWGIRSPVILLPEESLEWTDEHKAVVLRHELAHIARADTLIQMLGVVAVALYWFNPLVWIAARGLRAEQERACDDMVLVSGTPPVEYAAHLLEVARSARALGPQGFVSLAMARPSQLEGRLLAVLNAPRQRVRISPATRKFALVAVALAFVTLSAFTPISRAAAALPRVIVPTIIASQFIAPSSPVAATDKATLTPVVPKAALDSQILKWIDVAPSGTLELDLETGAGLTITSWAESRVEVRGTLAGRNWRDTEVSLQRTSTGARLVTRLRDKYGNQSTSHHFDIRLPSRYNLRISSAGGGVSISNLNGEFIGHTGGGAIRIDNSNGRAELTTGGGNIRVTSSNLSGSVTTGGGTVIIQDVNGGLTGHSGSMGTVYANSGGTSSRTSVSVGRGMPHGNISDDDGSVTIGSGANVTINERTGEIRDPDGRVIYRKAGGRVNVDEAMKGADVRTGGGSVTIGRSAGDVIAHTGGGDVSIGPLSGSAEAQTGAGDVTIEFRGVRSPSADVTTGKGRVAITLPADFTGTLDLETAYTNNHGRRAAIQSDWPLNITETPQWDDRNGTPRKFVRARQSIGTGRGVIRVQTVNGDVVIQRGR